MHPGGSRRTGTLRVPPSVLASLATRAERSSASETGSIVVGMWIRLRQIAVVAEDLRRVREWKPIAARPASSWTRLRRWTRRNPALAASLYAGAVILVAGAAVSTFFAVSAARSAQEARAAGDSPRTRYKLSNLILFAPDLNVADEMISSVPGHQDLYLSITQRCKYTTMLRMTYQFEEDGQPLFEPDLHLKIYHDARVVEVQQFQSRSRGPLYLADLIEQKWLMNRFLYKWLGYCHFQGHYFEPISHLKVSNK